MRALTRFAFVATFSIVCLAIPHSFGQDETESPDSLEKLVSFGNAAFDEGDFPTAIDRFEKAVDLGFLSPEVFLLLGNAHYRSGSDGLAALWWRRSQISDPLLAEATQNLRFLEKKSGMARFDRDAISDITNRLPTGWWLSIGITGSWLILIGIIALSLRPPRRSWRRLSKLSLWLGGIVAAVGFLGLFLKIRREIPHHQSLAIVTTNTIARSSATADGASVIEMPAGSEITILGERGPWTYIGIPGNLRGWIRSDSSAKLWPFDLGYLR